MLNNARIRALLSEADAQQQARARLYQRLDQLVDLCDVRTFVDVLADVAALQSRLGSPARAREWGLLREFLEEFLRENPPARCARRKRAGKAMKVTRGGLELD